MKVVKTRRLRYERKLLAIQILVLIFASFNVLSGNISNVSAVPVSPYVAVLPEKTIDPTITVGMNYTISIYTDYAGSDVWGWEFELSFDPDVLHGGINTTTTWTGNGDNKIFQVPSTRRPVASDPPEKVYVNQALVTRNVDYTIDYPTGRITFTNAPSNEAEVKATYLGDGVVSGNLISRSKDTAARFTPGKFDNIAGKLSLTLAYFYYTFPDQPFATSGPGILANVTFTVVGIGYSDITLGKATRLLAPPDFIIDPENPIPIIDANGPSGRTEPPYGLDHIGHGYFDNSPNVHDVAISKLEAPTTAIRGNLVTVNVTVRNDGTLDENLVEVTVTYDETEIGSQSVSLLKGESKILSFTWDTTSTAPDTYTVKAEATISDVDADQNNNIGYTSVHVETPPAPQPGHIAGIVKDASTGNPIEGANVTANGHFVLTEADGSYSVELAPGTYMVTVSADGYADSSQTDIIVNTGESTTVNFELTPAHPSVPQPNILLYIALAVVAVVIIAGIALYFLKAKK